VAPGAFTAFLPHVINDAALNEEKVRSVQPR
jgi:hypothetical protein